MSSQTGRWAGARVFVAVLALGAAASAMDQAAAPATDQVEPSAQREKRRNASALTVRCGVPVRRSMRAGEKHVFRFSAPSGTVVVVQATDVSGSLGLMRLGISNDDRDTCTGARRFVSGGGETRIEISDCRGADEGQYTLSVNVVSEGEANCGRPLSCGATPDGVSFSLAGEVDAFTFTGQRGQDLGYVLTDLSGNAGGIRTLLFDPSGVPVQRGESCADRLRVELPSTGQYTLLVGSCGAPRRGPYRVSWHGEGCSVGPHITTFGVTNDAGLPVPLIGFDRADRPIFFRSSPDRMRIVVEARPGMADVPVAASTVDDGRRGLDALASRPVGEDGTSLCPVSRAGVLAEPVSPASNGVELNDATDIGCRFVDEDGVATGVGPDQACTRKDRDSSFGFLDPTSTIQYCASVTEDWALPSGDTVVRATVSDADGNVGAAREIIIRVATLVGSSPPPSATATWTATRTRTATFTRTPTATRTRTRTRVPSATSTSTQPRTPASTSVPTATVTGGPTETPAFAACSGDCDGDGEVLVHELVVAVNIALSGTGFSACSAADADRDGDVTVAELVRSVQKALLGC